ncbi:hypothetical protein ACKWRH_05825 [Bradyrhizobium sp. Pa8]|uniref:hypothetical protein n=1 Tax=Bradyrhizobium sp. Pa8 TaxID=3386552 RepID=UPI00403F28B2
MGTIPVLGGENAQRAGKPALACFIQDVSGCCSLRDRKAHQFDCFWAHSKLFGDKVDAYQAVVRSNANTLLLRPRGRKLPGSRFPAGFASGQQIVQRQLKTG